MKDSYGKHGSQAENRNKTQEDRNSMIIGHEMSTLISDCLTNT